MVQEKLASSSSSSVSHNNNNNNGNNNNSKERRPTVATPIIDNQVLASMLRESAQIVERGEFEPILYTALQDFRTYYKEHYPVRKASAAAAASAAEDEEEPDGKGIRSLEKILTDGSWSWHTNSLDTPSFGSIRFLEGGKVAGVSWLTGWEALDSSKFKIIFQNNNRPAQFYAFFPER